MRKVARQTGLSGTDSLTPPIATPTGGTFALTATNGSGANRIPLTARTPLTAPTSTDTSTSADGSPTTPTPTTTSTTPTTTDKPTTTTGTTRKTGTTDTTSTPTSTPTSPTTSKSDSTSTTPSTTSDFSTTSTTSPTASTTSSPSSSSTNSTPTLSSASSQSSSSTPPLTTSFTTITTAVNGQLTTLTSPLPTSLSTSLPSNATNRTAVIAGSTAAAVVVILLILGGVFLHHRHKLRQRQAISSIHSRSRSGPREGRGLLAGEDFDFDDSHLVHMHSYRDSELSASMATRSAGTLSPQSLSPSLHRHRASDTGSIFREEEVWPPPGEFEDPFLRSVRRNQEVDLGRIVDDIMGHPEEYRTGHAPTPSSSSGNEADRSTSPSARRTHRASDSDTSYTGLMDGFRNRQQSPTSSSSLYKDPYTPFRDSLGGQGKGDSTTVYTPLPPGAAVPLQDSGHDPMVIAPGAYSLKPPLRVQNATTGENPAIGGIAASKPKKPSPLARAMSNASIKMGGLWLNRKLQHRADRGDADVDSAIGMAL